MHKENFISWFAGFFDGEGSIGIQIIQTQTGIVFQPKIQISQQDTNILKEIKKKLQIKNKIQIQKLQNINQYIVTKQVHLLVVSNLEDCLRISKLIYPFVKVKRKQLQIFIEFLEILGKKFSRKNRELVYNKFIEFYPDINKKNKQKILHYINRI